MSCNQFASNVVEKSIKISPDDYKLKIWKNITKYGLYLMLGRKKTCSGC